MRLPLPASLTCVAVAGSFGAAMAPTDPEQRVAIGIAVGTLSAMVYLYREEAKRRFDGIERRLDAISRELMRLEKA